MLVTKVCIIWYSEPSIALPPNFPHNFSPSASLAQIRFRSLSRNMADLDLKRQMEEAAAERSNIAQALLGIQGTLDQIAPSVL